MRRREMAGLGVALILAAGLVQPASAAKPTPWATIFAGVFKASYPMTKTELLQRLGARRADFIAFDLDDAGPGGGGLTRFDARPGPVRTVEIANTVEDGSRRQRITVILNEPACFTDVQFQRATGVRPVAQPYFLSAHDAQWTEFIGLNFDFRLARQGDASAVLNEGCQGAIEINKTFGPVRR